MTTFAASFAAYLERIPSCHVEAGLRTGNRYHPFPEEMNRVLTTRLADLHFAPTTTARDRLLAEGVPADTVLLTGNTVIDALLATVRQDYGFATPALAALDPALPARAGDDPSAGKLRRAAAQHLRGARRSGRAAFPTSRSSCRCTPIPTSRRTVEEILCDTPRVHLIAAGGLRRVRPPDGPGAPDPDRQRRRAGGGAQPGQAGAGPAGDDRAAGGRGRRNGGGGRHRP